MGDQVQVSWQGMRQLVTLTNDQYLNLSEASGFMCTGQLNNSGAFSGFLGLFRGTYEDALATVTESIGNAMDAAKKLSATIDDVRADLHETDTDVSVLHTKLDAQVGCQSYVPGQGGGVPQVPDNLVNANNVLDFDTPMTGPRNPWWIPGASTGDPLDLADNLMSLAENADGMGSGLDHGDEADDYVEEHRP